MPLDKLIEDLQLGRDAAALITKLRFRVRLLYATDTEPAALQFTPLPTDAPALPREVFEELHRLGSSDPTYYG